MSDAFDPEVIRTPEQIAEMAAPEDDAGAFVVRGGMRAYVADVVGSDRRAIARAIVARRFNGEPAAELLEGVLKDLGWKAGDR